MKILAVDECYPEDITSEFQKYIGLVNVDNVNDCYQLVKEVIQGYNGNAEKFYPRFYKAVSDASRPFKTLSRNAGLILAFEVANHVLAHLSDSTLENDVITSKASAKFDEKEKAIIYYISGYVFGTMYRRIFYKSTENNEQSFYHQQYLSILLAGKLSYEHEIPGLYSTDLVDARDRGGLWKVTRDVVDIFTEAEACFREYVKTSTKKINAQFIVLSLMKNCSVLTNLKKLRNSASDNIKKEVAVNFLEDLLMLYIRVRTFSYVKNLKECHKIKFDKKRSSSLRTELKKKTSSLELGH